MLITGARAPVALDLARSFAGVGHTPHLADCVRPRLAQAAFQSGPGKGRRLHRFSSPRFAFDRFRSDLDALVTALDPVLIVPTCEEIFYVAEAARQGGYADRVFAPPPALLTQLHSKAEFPLGAAALGVRVPHTQRLASPEALAAVAGDAPRLVFKPEFSRFGSRALVRPDAAQLARICPSPSEPWVAQEALRGEEVCVWSAAVKGRLVAFCAYVPRWRVGRSAAFYIESDPDPALLAMARTLAQGWGATGQFAYDVMRAGDGTIMPIECNPRAVSGLHLFDGDPALARSLQGQETDVVAPSAGACRIGPAMLLLGGAAALASGRLGPFRRDWARSRDAVAGGGAAVLQDAARYALAGWAGGRSATAQTTHDIEWNGDTIV